MRKALIGLIMAATVLTPVAAEARGGRGDRGGHVRSQNEGGHRGGNSGGGQRHSDSPPPQQQQQQAPPQQQQQAPVVQRQHNDGGNRGANRGGGGNRGDRGARNNQGSAYPQAWQGNPNDPRLQHYRNLERRNQERYGRRGDRDGDRNWRGRDNDRRGDRNWRERRGDRRDWNRGWRNDRRYDWSSWRHRNRHIFHLPIYYSPYRDWRYQRFSIGFFLEPLFFDQRYWIGDPYYYRLPPAPPGTQWVRYYNDVLLVDVYSGEVIDVIYDFFW